MNASDFRGPIRVTAEFSCCVVVFSHVAADESAMNAVDRPRGRRHGVHNRRTWASERLAATNRPRRIEASTQRHTNRWDKQPLAMTKRVAMPRKLQ
jgi:hypothetical protein